MRKKKQQKGRNSFQRVGFILSVALVVAGVWFCIQKTGKSITNYELLITNDRSPKSEMYQRPEKLQDTAEELPTVAQVLEPSPAYSSPVLSGLKIDPQNPFQLEFIIDPGDQNEVDEQDVSALVKYFLAGLTIPEEELWVNLSPYESDRIIPQNVSYTDLGKDLLSQDYLLKQLVASLMYPESKIGERYWQRLYHELRERFGTSRVSVDTFSKVWIVPAHANIYEDETTAVITDASLKVLSEEDYVALRANKETEEATNNMPDTRYVLHLKQCFYCNISGGTVSVRFFQSFQSRSAGHEDR